MPGSQTLTDDTSKICNCDLGCFQLRMPQLFPFETVEALVSNGTQGFDLASYRDIALTCQNTFAAFSASGRVFQMCMSYPGSQLLDGKFWILVRSSKRVVCVPEQAYMIGIRGAQYILERYGGGEVVMRLD